MLLFDHGYIAPNTSQTLVSTPKENREIILSVQGQEFRMHS